MSLASAVVLLQTALSLLVLVNSNPSLPQSMRDTAQQVAQQAIAQATDALKQNGAVAQVAADGPSQARTTTKNTSNTSTVSPNLAITLGNVSTTPSSAHVEWNTNIPTDSKLFYQTASGTSQVVPSESGRSTHHIVDIANLTAGTQYAYSIEAIAGQQDQTQSDSFSTDPAPFEVYQLTYEPGSNDFYYSGNKTLDISKLSIVKGARISTSQNPDGGMCDTPSNTCLDFHTQNPLPVSFTISGEQTYLSGDCTNYGAGNNITKVCGYYVTRLVPSVNLQNYADAVTGYTNRTALHLKMTIVNNDGQSYSGKGQIIWDGSAAAQQSSGSTGTVVSSSDFTQPNF